MNEEILNKEGLTHLVEKIKENFASKEDFKAITELPETGEPGKIYIVQEGDTYTQYIYSEENGWEEIGGTNVQHDTLPEADSTNVGQIIQYTGDTEGGLEQGHFYICVEDAGSGIPVYHWEEINVQDDGLDNIGVSYLMYAPNDQIDTATNREIVNNWLQDILAGKFSQLWLYGTFAQGATYYRNKYAAQYAVDIPDEHGRCTISFKLKGNTIWGKVSILAYRDNNDIVTRLSCSGNNGYMLAEMTNYAVPLATDEATDTYPRSVLSTTNTQSYTPTANYHPATKKYVDDTVSSAMSATVKRETVQQLPTTDIKTDTIYMVPSSNPGSQNVYEEYMYINNAWEKIGDTEVDLSNYVTTTAMETYVEENATQQVTTMPTADSSNVGEIVQYVGTTSGDLQSGHFYICTQEAGSGVPVYTWTEILVQDGVVTAPVPQGITDVTYGAYRSYPGYSDTGTQILKNINGVLTWVDEI